MKKYHNAIFKYYGVYSEDCEAGDFLLKIFWHEDRYLGNFIKNDKQYLLSEDNVENVDIERKIKLGILILVKMGGSTCCDKCKIS